MLLSSCLELGIVYFLAAMTPGPSVALIIKNGFLGSRLASVNAALGTVVGNALQAGMVLIGISFLKNCSIFFQTIKLLCSIYLVYLGLKALFYKDSADQIIGTFTPKKQWSYFFEGFLVEFLNPLAFAFFTSVLTIIFIPEESLLFRFIYWTEIIILAIILFLSVALISSSEKINFYTKKNRKILVNCTGIIFLILGSKMLIK